MKITPPKGATVQMLLAVEVGAAKRRFALAARTVKTGIALEIIGRLGQYGEMHGLAYEIRRTPSQVSR